MGVAAALQTVYAWHEVRSGAADHAIITAIGSEQAAGAVIGKI
jgi:hypothetical protein